MGFNSGFKGLILRVNLIRNSLIQSPAFRGLFVASCCSNPWQDRQHGFPTQGLLIMKLKPSWTEKYMCTCTVRCLQQLSVQALQAAAMEPFTPHLTL